jgi:DNA-binding NtrC family response regulator
MTTPLHVLLVEDSEDDAVLLLHALRKGGFEPTYERVDTAPAMSAALARKSWDIVIADHSMPHFDATAALNLLKQSGSDLPFIIVSGSIGEEIAVGAMKLGAHDYVMKGNLTRLCPSLSARCAKPKSDASAAVLKKRLNTRLITICSRIFPTG